MKDDVEKYVKLKETLTLMDPVGRNAQRCMVRVKRRHMNNVICDQNKNLSGLKDKHSLFCLFCCFYAPASFISEKYHKLVRGASLML